MPGVTWSERQSGDWLASNGRWYPASKRPSSWNFLALPPAPGHGRVETTLRSESQRVSASSSYTPPARHTAESQQPQGQQPRPQPRSTPATNSPAPTRAVADATVTNVSNYKRRIEAGNRPAGALPPPPILPNSPAVPPPPGRVSPASQSRARTKPTTVAQASAAAYAGDFGRVLGKARKKLEEAINEASQEE